MVDLKKILNAYFQKHDDVVAVYLFGSHAIGTDRSFSDVDIGIILKHQVVCNATALRKIYIAELGRAIRKDIHPVILNSAGEFLLKQVFKKGVCVCINDASRLRQFKMIRYAMISEFDYYLKLTQRGFQRRALEVCRDG
jgi:predicted nucleotidyltransferase